MSNGIVLGTGKIIPGKEYTMDQLQKLVRNEDDAARVAWQGYVLRHDLLKDTYMLVHWTNSAARNAPIKTDGPTVYTVDDLNNLKPEEVTGLKGANRPFGAPRMAFDPYAFAPPPPIQKRTPAERKASLINKWFEACQRAGTVPGLTDEQVSKILGENWKTGKSQMTAEVVDRLASVMLGQAEAQHEDKLAHQVTRHET